MLSLRAQGSPAGKPGFQADLPCYRAVIGTDPRGDLTLGKVSQGRAKH